MAQNTTKGWQTRLPLHHWPHSASAPCIVPSCSSRLIFSYFLFFSSFLPPWLTWITIESSLLIYIFLKTWLSGPSACVCGGVPLNSVWLTCNIDFLFYPTSPQHSLNSFSLCIFCHFPLFQSHPHMIDHTSVLLCSGSDHYTTDDSPFHPQNCLLPLFEIPPEAPDDSWWFRMAGLENCTSFNS